MEQEKKTIWFKRKSYGWGWTPCSWQGWAVLGVYLLIFVLLQSLTSGPEYSDSNLVVRFVFPVIILTSILIVICYKKGEKPAWQWGGTKEEK